MERTDPRWVVGADRHRLGGLRRLRPTGRRSTPRSAQAVRDRDDQQVHQLRIVSLSTSRTSSTSARRAATPTSASSAQGEINFAPMFAAAQEPREVLPRPSATRSRIGGPTNFNPFINTANSAVTLEERPGAGALRLPADVHRRSRPARAAAANAVPVTVTNDGDAPLTHHHHHASRRTPSDGGTATTAIVSQNCSAPAVSAAPQAAVPTSRPRRRGAGVPAAPASSTSASSPRAPTTPRSRASSSRSNSDDAMDRVLLAAKSTGDALEHGRRQRPEPCSRSASSSAAPSFGTFMPTVTTHLRGRGRRHRHHAPPATRRCRSPTPRTTAPGHLVNGHVLAAAGAQRPGGQHDQPDAGVRAAVRGHRHGDEPAHLHRPGQRRRRDARLPPGRSAPPTCSGPALRQDLDVHAVDDDAVERRASLGVTIESPGRRERPGLSVITAPMTYVAADRPLRRDALPPLRAQRPPAARRSRSACGTTSATTSRSTTQRAILRRAFDLGVTHFDLANNYGPPYGTRRDQLRPASCARTSRPTATSWSSPPRPARTCGPARTAIGGSRKYLLASLDQSLQRMGLDYVDIFYSHRFDPDTPLEETHGRARHRGPPGQGALRRHLAPTRPSAPREAAQILRELGHAAAHPPAVVLAAQPLDRGRTCSTCSAQEGVGCIAFSPLAQGLLTDRYLDGIPEGSRADARATRSSADMLDRRDARARPRAQRDRAAAAASRWRRWRSPGRCATRASPRR